MKFCIVGASGKLGQYMVQHCLDRGYEVVGICRAEERRQARPLQGQDRRPVRRHRRPRDHQAGRRRMPRRAHRSRPLGNQPLCGRHRPGGDGLTPSPARGSSSPAAGTSAATARTSIPGSSDISCRVIGWLAKLFRAVDLDDQVEATRRIFASRQALDRRARQRPGGGRQPGPAGVEPTCGRSGARQQQDPAHRFRPVHGRALTDDTLVHEAPAIVGRETPSALAHGGVGDDGAGW